MGESKASFTCNTFTIMFYLVKKFDTLSENTTDNFFFFKPNALLPPPGVREYDDYRNGF